MERQLRVTTQIMQNAETASRLEEVADLIKTQRANPFRVQADQMLTTGHRAWQTMEYA
jgi:hypothetical protein